MEAEPNTSLSSSILTLISTNLSYASSDEKRFRGWGLLTFCFGTNVQEQGGKFWRGGGEGVVPQAVVYLPGVDSKCPLKFTFLAPVAKLADIMMYSTVRGGGPIKMWKSTASC